MRRQKYTPASLAGCLHVKTELPLWKSAEHTAVLAYNRSQSPWGRPWKNTHERIITAAGGLQVIDSVVTVVRELPYDFCAASAALALRV